MRKIKWLIVHHTASEWGDAKAVRQWHCGAPPVGRGWKNPGYHKLILNPFPSFALLRARAPLIESDGRVEIMLPDSEIANGCKGANAEGLHICWVGNFDKGDPTARQTDSMITELAAWCKIYALDPAKAIKGHGEAQRFLKIEKYSKSCPGARVQMDGIRGLVAERLKK